MSDWSKEGEESGTINPELTSRGTCRCKAHAQHRVYQWLYFHPGASLAASAVALHISESNARMIATRLRRRSDHGRLCPLCFASAFYRGACQKCGFEAGADVQPVTLDFESQNPVHRILRGDGLGSELTTSNYAALARKMYQRDKLPPGLLRNHGRNLAHLAEPKDDSLLRAVRSDLLEELKRSYPNDGISDMAAKLATQEVREFRARYPLLGSPKRLREQVVGNVLARLRLLYPTLPVAPMQVLGGESRE
jgi:hypothetical protein